MDGTEEPRQPQLIAGAAYLPPDVPNNPLDFLSRAWTVSTTQLSKSLPPSTSGGAASATIPENAAGELEGESSLAGNPFSFASSATSQLVLERIMSQSEVSPLTSGRLSHSSGPLTDSPPVSPSEIDDAKLCRSSNTPRAQYRGGSRTVGRWLKDRKERRKEETRAHNAQLHAAVSVAGVAAAVAAIASATAASSASAGYDRAARVDMAVASAATLVAAQCVEAADSLGAERDHLASVVGSAVSVRTPGDVATLTAAAATALRGAATLKARALKEVWNIAAVIPVEKGCNVNQHHHGHYHHRQKSEQEDSRDELVPAEDLVGLCNQELLARGIELLKRTRKGALHWKMVSVYLHRTGVVMLKTKSRHVGGTITKKKKKVVTGVCKEVPAWPGRHLLEGEEEHHRRRYYFGLKIGESRRVIEFECRSRREYEAFTQGVPRLLDIVAHKHKQQQQQQQQQQRLN